MQKRFRIRGSGSSLLFYSILFCRRYLKAPSEFVIFYFVFYIFVSLIAALKAQNQRFICLLYTMASHYSNSGSRPCNCMENGVWPVKANDLRINWCDNFIAQYRHFQGTLICIIGDSFHTTLWQSIVINIILILTSVVSFFVNT